MVLNKTQLKLCTCIRQSGEVCAVKGNSTVNINMFHIYNMSFESTRKIDISVLNQS